jgi:predicted 2-oxoglutarate/Fe(II)-dependent dioxygenase YbiX
MAAIIGALQLVFDFGGRARIHEVLQRRYFELGDEKDGSGRKVLGRGQEGLQVAKVREHAGLRERSAVLTLINETLSRTVAPVKQFLGLLV